MRWPLLSTAAWKVLLATVALIMTGFWFSELWHAPRTLAPGAAGTLGIEYHERAEWGRSQYRIDAIARDSPLQAVGARIGDIWIPDRPYDAERRLEAHEPIGLTLIRDGTARHIIVQTVPDPRPPDTGLYVMAWAISLITLVLGLLIGVRLANGRAFRALALGALSVTGFKLIPTHLILPAGPAFWWHHLCWPPGLALICAGFMVFFFNYPDDQPRDTALKRGLLRYGVPVLASFLMTWTAAGIVRAAGYHVPLYTALGLATNSVLWFMSLAIMVDNWRRSEGDLRQRHFWILIALASLTFTAPLVALFRAGAAALGLAPDGTWWLVRSLALSAWLLFGYAVLRQRVMSIGFAVNRVMVYGAASVGMLLTFGLLEWAAHHLFAFAGREKSVLLDGAIALGIFLVFHRLRHAGETLIERLFFHAWHVKEAAFRKFVKEAAYVTRPDALLKSFTTALDRFTDGAPHALYRRAASGDYERVAANLAGAPDAVDADEPLLVSLRASQAATHCADTETSLPGELALPSVHHGQLDGFVLLGPKPKGEVYRPDEREVLSYAAHQVGLDFRALRMEQLEHEVAEARRIIEQLRGAAAATGEGALPGAARL